MKEGGQLNSIVEVVELGCRSKGKHWFRGEPLEYEKLNPKAFRSFFSAVDESKMAREFKRQAPAIASDLPAPDDYIGWLVLMQHHGLATRLLDWSENVLVALYFAVSELPSQDGRLLALEPAVMNRQALQMDVQDAASRADALLALSTDPRRMLQFLAHGPFAEKPGDLTLVSDPAPVAFSPPQRFLRMVAQASVMTIHPSPSFVSAIKGKEKKLSFDSFEISPGEPPGLEAYLPSSAYAPTPTSDWLESYTIPARAKGKLRRDLAALGVTQRTLFPDLDNLSRSLIQESSARMEEFAERAKRER